MLIEATLLLPDDRVSSVSIRNISAEGFMGETQAQVLAGARIGLALAGCGILPALVRWNEAGEIGAQFLVPFDLDQLRHATEQRTGAAALFPSRVVRGPL